MIRKKICMLGGVSVGKTSLVRRFVDSMFDERYHHTIGVKIDKKLVEHEGHDVTLMLWDIQGEDEKNPVREAYIKGMDGYLLVLDSTRPETAEMALRVHERILQLHDSVPFILVLNKTDLMSVEQPPEAMTKKLIASAQQVLRTSAKTGEGVDSCFAAIAQAVMPAAVSRTNDTAEQ